MRRIDLSTGRFLAIPPIERFWVNVKKTRGCWLWNGCILTSGYGQICIYNKQKISTHRFSYELHKGKIPKGMCVCHHCDNKRCVNPEHLWLGTSADNTADRDRKNRGCRGEKSHLHKLTEKKVKAIREEYSPKYGEYVRLAKKYGVERQAIKRVIKKIYWRHI